MFQASKGELGKKKSKLGIESRLAKSTDSATESKLFYYLKHCSGPTVKTQVIFWEWLREEQRKGS